MAGSVGEGAEAEDVRGTSPQLQWERSKHPRDKPDTKELDRIEALYVKERDALRQTYADALFTYTWAEMLQYHGMHDKVVALYKDAIRRFAGTAEGCPGDSNGPKQVPQTENGHAAAFAKPTRLADGFGREGCPTAPTWAGPDSPQRVVPPFRRHSDGFGLI